jgi:hypothetical protein
LRKLRKNGNFSQLYAPANGCRPRRPAAAAITPGWGMTAELELNSVNEKENVKTVRNENNVNSVTLVL